MSKRRGFSLYVGDLLPAVTESELIQRFSKIGPIYSVHVCIDSDSKCSLGYAYVNYAAKEDAETAIDCLNSILIRGRPCRVMWSQRDSSFRNSGEGNIIVQNLDKSICQDKLYNLFSTYGRVTSCKIPLNNRGERKSFGYVQYENANDALLAISKTNGSYLAGLRITVEAFKSAKAQKEKIPENNGIEISGLPLKWDTCRVANLIEEYGDIINIEIMRDEDGNTIGCANCTFVDEDSAEEAVRCLNGFRIEGTHKILVRSSSANQKAKISSLLISGYNCKVSCLEPEITEERLFDFFKQFGTVTTCIIIRDHNNKSRGYGYVCFENEDQGKQAIMSMNGRAIISNPLFITPAPIYKPRSNPVPSTSPIRPSSTISQYANNLTFQDSQKMFSINSTFKNAANFKIPPEVENSFYSRQSKKNMNSAGVKFSIYRAKRSL